MGITNLYPIIPNTIPPTSAPNRRNGRMASMDLSRYSPFNGVILRIQNSKKYGPYTQCKGLIHAETDCPCDPSRHPNWDLDSELPRISEIGGDWINFVFGFVNTDQYIRWFYTKKARQFLEKNKHKLYLIKSPRVYASRRQCIFLPPKNNTTYLREYPPTILDTSPKIEDEIREIQYAYQKE